ncbi:MAG: thiamine phosphate synthase [Methanobrevibacter sp.]|jgi:thiamine-phosphate pyrophosphorylase|nr:thiamine phosphate synthase [Methanobrevibacter sp.]
MIKNLDLSLYLITNRNNKTEEEFFNIIKSSILGGASILQLREKIAGSKEFYEISNKVKKLTNFYNIPLIINDRVDIAISVNADGVHVGDEDIDCNIMREKIGFNKIIGVSASNVEDAIIAEKNGADYIGSGAIFPTKTKDTNEISINELKKIVNSVKIPVVAIGGINKENVSLLKNTGIKGVAVISSVMESKNPKKTSEELKNKITTIINS